MKKNIFSKDRILDLIFYFIVIMSGLYQLSVLGAHRMHMDEALYVSWALKIADGSDLFLHHTITDKFPLLSYIMAFFIKLFGSSETIVKIPSLLFTIGGFFVFYRAAEKLYDKKTGVLGVLAIALTKYYVIYGPTAFTDQAMTFFVILSLLMLVEKKYYWSGIFIGVSAMAKLTGLYFSLPFVIGIFIMSLDIKRDLKAFSQGLGLTCLIIFLWAGLVELNAFKLFFANSPIPYKGTLDMNSFRAGFDIIKNYQFDLMGAAKLIVALIGGLILMIVNNSKKKIDLIILLTVVLFYLTLLFMTFRHVPIFERYLVVIVPFIALLLARTVVYIYELLSSINKVAGLITAGIIFIVALLPFNKKMDIAAFYSVNDGLEAAIKSIPDRQNAVVLSMGLNTWVALYYFNDFANYSNQISGIEAEKEIDKNFIVHNEGRPIYIITAKNGAELIDKEIKMISGIYYEHRPVLKNITYYNGEPKYYVYEIEKNSKLKEQYVVAERDITPAIKMDVEFVNGIKLLGFDYRRLKGNKIEFVYYWKKVGSVNNNWLVNVNFINTKVRIKDGDHYLAQGLVRFDTLKIGTVIKDIDIVNFVDWKKVNTMRIGLLPERHGKSADFKGENELRLDIK